MFQVLSRRVVSVSAVFILCFSSLAVAQTGPELLIKPWPTGQQFQSQGEITLVNHGSTHHSDDFDISFYDISGRLRLLSDWKADPRFGFNYTQIHTSGDPAVPGNMVDTSLGFGMGVADWEGWQAGVTLGVGYAGAGAFDDGNAWYGMADFIVGHKIDNTSSLGLVLDYDGNRTYMPDVPLPGFLYTKRLEPNVLLGIGFPYTSVEYKINDQLTLSGQIYVPDSFSARLDYSVVKEFGIFLQATSRREAFKWDELPNSADRVIYDSRRAELGARWTPAEWINLIVAGGYLFDQEFNVGWDTRDQDRLAKPSDEMYCRFSFEMWH